MTDNFRIQWFRCQACGAANQTIGDICEACGTANADATGSLRIRLQFAAGGCLDCGEPGVPGVCSKCGGEIGPAETDEVTQARVRAFGPLRERAHALVASFDAFPHAHISVTASQLVSVIVDANLPARAIELIRFAHRTDELDLENKEAIGGVTRRALAAVLDEVKRVRDEARLLGEFKANEPVAELPRLVARLGAQAALVVQLVIAALSAASFTEAMQAAAELQQALEPHPDAQEIERLLGEVPRLPTSEDTDARISLALGREANYTDDFGLPDPVRIFTPASPGDTSFAPLAEGAGRYLSHLLDRAPEELENADAMLALSAVPLALLDRPFAHHRRAELIRSLLRDAAATDVGSLDAALALYDEHAGQAFETSMRVRRQLRLLATGELESPIEIVESLVEAYRRLAEGHFRAAMRAVLAARAAQTGAHPPDESLLLGEIEGILAGWHSELGASLQGVIERHLRNAEAHEEYYVDPETLEIVLADEARMTVNQLFARTEDLVGTIAAIDAAIVCHTIDARRPVAPQWLAQGRYTRLSETIMRIVGAGFGVAVERVVLEAEVATIFVAPDQSLTRSRARTVLAAARRLFPGVSSLELREGQRLVAAFGTDVVDRWSAASPNDQAMALIEVVYDCAIRRGEDPAETLRDALAVAVRALINDTAAEISTPPTPGQVRQLTGRLRSIARFAAKHRAGSMPELAVAAGALRAARASLAKAARSEDEARRFVRAIEVLSAWADPLATDWLD